MNMYQQEQKAVMIAIREYIEALPRIHQKHEAANDINMYLSQLIFDAVALEIDNIISDAIKKAEEIQGQQKQTLYDWSDPRIPEWVQWIGTDANGEVYGYVNKPIIDIDVWDVTNLFERYGSGLLDNDITIEFVDWQESLEKRPK